MKTLYLHIGTPKTATSSIQKFLLINQAALEQRSYCFPRLQHKYPYVHDNRNAHFMVCKLYKEDGSRNKALEKEHFKEGLENVLHCFEQFDHVVLSEETIWRFSSRARKKLFPDLAAHAKKNGYQVKIIVYLRRQDSFQISNWKQNVKHPKTSMTTTFDERIQQVMEEESYVLNYASKLDEISGYFGKENVIVRRFEPDSWLNGSIIDDFMNCIGLTVTDDFIPLPKDINPSLYGNTTEIKRIINKDTTFTQQENNYLGKFLWEMSAESSQLYSCSMMSVEETRNFLKNFEEENARVAEEYIGDGKPLFSDKIKDLPKWKPDNPYMNEDIIRFFSTVSIDLHRENESLRAELSDLQSIIKKQQQILDKQQQRIEKQQQDFRLFKDKLKHPLRTLWNRIFGRRKEQTKE